MNTNSPSKNRRPCDFRIHGQTALIPLSQTKPANPHKAPVLARHRRSTGVDMVFKWY
ncbi:hypothetical protein EMIT048CA2_30337 [Pseudomonas chlororaphis]